MNSLTSPVDIRPDHLAIVQGILREHLPVDAKVWVFGSRANWTTKDSSDLDLALDGESKLSHKLLGALKDAFEDSTLPYTVDVVDLNAVSHAFKQIVKEQRVALTLVRAPGRVDGAWREVTLGDVAVIVMGQSPAGAKVSGNNGLALLNGPTEFGASHPTPVQFTTDARKYAQPGDILFCVRGSTTGRMNWADQEYAIGRGVAAIRHKNDSALQPFVRGVIELGLPELLVQATGSTFPNVSAQQLAEIPYPSLDEDEQRTIAHVLGTLDDKIELNRRMNETLEAMARALFKSWFVDFEPVRAKMEGRWCPGESLPGLLAHLYDLFPDRLVDSELGQIPKGWEVKPLGEVARQRRSGVKPDEIDAESPYIALEHMPKRCIALTQWSNADGLASGKFKFEQGDILFGKLRPYFHKVGVAPLDGVCSTDIVVVHPKSTPWFGFVLGHTSSAEFVDYTDATSTGTRMPRTNWADMARYKVALPTIEVSKAFTGLVEPCVNRIVSATHESHSLAAQRDTLLPGLVSGELAVGTE